MPIYQYSGINAQGQIENGMMPARSEDAVRKRLQSKGIKIRELTLAQSGGDPLTEGSIGQVFSRSSEKSSQESASADRAGVPLHHLQFFFRQMSSMLSAGIAPSQMLATLSGQTQNDKLRSVLLETKTAVDAGQQISSVFEIHPEVFSPLMISMVHAGEEGGFLAEQCGRLSEYIQREIELRNMIRRETLYPKIVVVSSIFIILAANWIISAVGQTGAQKLWSPLTQLSTWIIIAPILVGLYIYFQVIKKNDRAKRQWDSAVLKVPYIGNISHGFAMAKFGRSFAALYGSGVPMPKALQLSADACGNEHLRAQIHPAARDLESGTGLTDSLAMTGAFSPIVLDMTRTGETTGNVDDMLNKMAEFYEEEGAMKARQAAVVIGVLAFIIVAVYISYVVIKFYTGYASQF
ncbi:MAG: type II secretion system F family protein [Armatimonadetes bacterium]|nr:type II secretion system F family protein [Armatimonadota bacterium]